MPTYEDIADQNENSAQGFDLDSLEVCFALPIQLCAMEITKCDNNKIVIGSHLKNVAFLKEESVNLSMDAMKAFKYSIKFDGIIVQATVPFDDDKYLATASVDQLREYLPQNVDLDVNRDLMGVAFDAFVVNRGNKNGHIISTEVALEMVGNFINKPFNIEHNRKVVVGVCTGYGFSEFGSSKPLTAEQIVGMKDPFNVVLSGYVWKIVNPDFAKELVESSDPSSNKYLSVSASWELGFNEFNIAKGSKNLAEAQIIENESEIQELKDCLKVFGGKGVTEDGVTLFLNLQGSVLPLGIGFTNTPAAEVAGVMISHDTKPSSEETSAAELDVSATTEEPECNKKSVFVENKNVKNIMQITNIDDITDDSIKEIAASAVREFISNSIADLAKEWEAKVGEKETSLKTAEEQIVSLKADLEAVKAEGEKVKEDFTALNESLKQKEIEATFQRRMALLDEEFDLTDEDRTIIAEDLGAIENDEQFEKWYKKFSTFAAAKKKCAKAEKKCADKEESEDGEEEEMKEEECAKKKCAAKSEETEVSASEEKTVEEVISSAEVKEEVLPNASSPQEPTLVEKINAAFNKNSVKIK